MEPVCVCACVGGWVEEQSTTKAIRVGSLLKFLFHSSTSSIIVQYCMVTLSALTDDVLVGLMQ